MTVITVITDDSWTDVSHGRFETNWSIYVTLRVLNRVVMAFSDDSSIDASYDRFDSD